jgi:hypothetical protein
MGYLDNHKCFRNDLYKTLYNDETSIHVNFTEGGIISWGVGVKKNPMLHKECGWFIEA